jgi:hypothetical protein
MTKSSEVSKRIKGKNNLIKLSEEKYNNLYNIYILLKLTSYKTKDEIEKYFELKDKLMNTSNYWDFLFKNIPQNKTNITEELYAIVYSKKNKDKLINSKNFDKSYKEVLKKALDYLINKYKAKMWFGNSARNEYVLFLD